MKNGENNDADIHELLDEAGIRWRSRQVFRPVMASDAIKVARGEGRSVGAMLVGATGTVAVAAIVLAVFALAPQPQRPSGVSSDQQPSSVPETTLTPDASPSLTAAASPRPSTAVSPRPSVVERDSVVVNGQAVQASGYLLHTPDGRLKLCRLSVVAGFGPGVCVEPSVIVRGIDGQENDLVGAYVLVVGSWDSGELVAESTTSASEAVRELPGAPCSEPSGGWPGNASGLEGEDAARRLDEYVSSRPETFAGIWSAATSGHSDRIFVVSTVVEPSEVEPDLREVFDGNLCVVRVEFSGQQLARTANRLRTEEPHWQVEIDAVRNRVLVQVPVVDSRTADKLADDAPLVIVEPLVQPKP